jgi:cyclin-dependent kinase 10
MVTPKKPKVNTTRRERTTKVVSARMASGVAVIAAKRKRGGSIAGPDNKEEERNTSSEGGRAREDRFDPPESARHRQRRARSGPDGGSRTTGGLFCGNCASIQGFEKVGRLGEGTYGIVYLAKDRRIVRRTQQIGASNDNTPLVALKRCIPHHQSTDGFPVTALREIAALRACADHPNVVRLESVAVSKSGVFLVLEYCEHDLARLLDDSYRAAHASPFSLAAAKSLAQDLLSAIRHCHDRCLLHRDVKPSNLLYTHRGTLKLADFGMSRFVAPPTSSSDANPPLTLTVASLWYRPPELLMGATWYTSAIDTWACGCVLAEIMLGRPALTGRTDQEQLKAILEHLGSWPRSPVYPKSDAMLRKMPSTRHGPSRKLLLDVFQDLTLAGLRLLTGLLHYDPQQRCTAAHALASPFLTGTDPPSPLPRDQMPIFASASTGTARR